MNWVLVVIAATHLSTETYFPTWEKCYSKLQQTKITKDIRMAYCRKVKE